MVGSGNVLTALSRMWIRQLIHSCKYRHALPEGYVYKTHAEREAEAAAREKDRSLDKNLMRLENIEHLRKQLPTTNLTPVTPETFAKWKQDRLERKKVGLKSVFDCVEGEGSC